MYTLSQKMSTCLAITDIDQLISIIFGTTVTEKSTQSERFFIFPPHQLLLPHYLEKGERQNIILSLKCCIVGFCRIARLQTGTRQHVA